MAAGKRLPEAGEEVTMEARSIESLATTPDGRLVNKLKLAMQEFQNIEEALPLQIAISFLMVAQNEGCSLTDIWKQTGWAQSTVSRHLLDLGEYNRHKEKGHGLVKSERDPMELRRNIYTLTPKGKVLAAKIIDIMKM
jgi:DNA-binding MarR family transcriptional regulator